MVATVPKSNTCKYGTSEVIPSGVLHPTRFNGPGLGQISFVVCIAVGTIAQSILPQIPLPLLELPGARQVTGIAQKNGRWLS